VDRGPRPALFILLGVESLHSSSSRAVGVDVAGGESRLAAHALDLREEVPELARASMDFAQAEVRTTSVG
jgi:hypothetical protein